MSDESKYVEPSAKARLVFAVAVGLLLLCVIGVHELLAGFLVPNEDANSASVESLGNRLKLATGLSTLVTLVVSIICTAYFWTLGTKSDCQLPVPPIGTLVVKRTQITSGRLARINGWISIGLAIISWVPVAIFACLLALVIELT